MYLDFNNNVKCFCHNIVKNSLNFILHNFVRISLPHPVSLVEVSSSDQLNHGRSASSLNPKVKKIMWKLVSN